MGLSIQETKFKIDFQARNCGGHLVFPIGMILAIFDLEVTSIILTKFQVNWPFGSAEAKNRFSRFLGFLIGTILAIFELQVSPMLPINFGDNWPFCSEEEAKNRFSRWPPLQPSWLSDRNDFSYF